MKIFIALVLSLGFCHWGLTQVNIIVHKQHESGYEEYEYLGQTKEYLIVKKYTKTIEIAKLDIIEMQTLGVHFSEDAYDNYLSGNNKRLDFDKLGKSKTSGFHISGRTVQDTLVILFKIKIGSGEERGIDPNHLNFSDGDFISIGLLNNDTINFRIYSPYFLTGWGGTIYNFGYLKPTINEIYALVNSPVKSILLCGVEFKIVDEYMLMRHLLALLDENPL